MDSALAIVIGGTGIFAATVAYLVTLGDHGRQRAALAAAGAAVAVAVGFLLMLLMAEVSVLATTGLLALLAGAVAYRVFLRDLGRRRAMLATAGATAVVTASFVLVVYLAFVAFVAAVGVYLLVRVRLRISAALVLASTTLSGLLATAALAFWLSLSYAM
ncbi:hypothetical protein Ais01nite_14550 [Asanoa ishikariensis]|uniref:Uncharacterized protein n=1 Tax=Asanoa ishikariensis TaxID=137265 RepID=A0A1H3UJT1_9ACTN|nr:hypothetical protein [Asanoa ishikariensis]GIF63420.1 hypothetical protein Ais01nite_14550 [Asanoa ishikariensis]SDZ62261.1 hypothetical protein SAMN05421684_7418 [Asanoa ishikariensis]